MTFTGQACDWDSTGYRVKFDAVCKYGLKRLVKKAFKHRVHNAKNGKLASPLKVTADILKLSKPISILQDVKLFEYKLSQHFSNVWPYSFVSFDGYLSLHNYRGMTSTIETSSVFRRERDFPHFRSTHTISRGQTNFCSLGIFYEFQTLDESTRP
jgi:hypothetical protein